VTLKAAHWTNKFGWVLVSKRETAAQSLAIKNNAAEMAKMPGNLQQFSRVKVL